MISRRKYDLINVMVINDADNIVVREATKHDAAQLLMHAKAILEEEQFVLTSPEEMTMNLAQETEWVENKIENPNHLLLVADDNGKVVGMLDLSNGHRKRIAHTSEFGMSVAKEYRNKGIGKKLIEAMIIWARNHPTLEKISLKVHADNERALHVYKTMGFTQEGCLKKELKYGPNKYVDSLILSLWV